MPDISSFLANPSQLTISRQERLKLGIYWGEFDICHSRIDYRQVTTSSRIYENNITLNGFISTCI